MNETDEKLEPYGTKLPPSQIKYLRRSPGRAAKLLRTIIAHHISREQVKRKRGAKRRAS